MDPLVDPLDAPWEDAEAGNENIVYLELVQYVRRAENFMEQVRVRRLQEIDQNGHSHKEDIEL